MEENKTTELDKVSPKKATLMIHGKEREIRFGFSAWRELEREYGGIKNITKMDKQIEENPFEVIPHLLYIGLVDKSAFKDDEGKEHPLTEENILDEYGLNDVAMITEVFQRALYGSLPEDNGEKKSKEMEA